MNDKTKHGRMVVALSVVLAAMVGVMVGGCGGETDQPAPGEADGSGRQSAAAGADWSAGQAIKRGDAFMQSGDYDAALEAFNQAIAQDPHRPDVLVKRAHAWDAKGDTAKAIADLTGAIELAPKDAALYLTRARLYRKVKQVRHVLSDCEQALHLNDNLADAHSMEAAMYCELGLFDRAAKSAQRAIALSAEHAPAYNNLGVAYMNTDQPAKAIEAFTEAIRINRQFVDAYNNRAQLLARADRFDEALSDWAEAMRLRPTDPQLLFDRGKAYLERRDAPHALADFDAAIDLMRAGRRNGQSAATLDAELAKLHVARAMAQIEAKAFTDAVKSCDQAIRLAPTLSIAYGVRGKAHQELGQSDKAQSDAATAKALSARQRQ